MAMTSFMAGFYPNSRIQFQNSLKFLFSSSLAVPPFSLFPSKLFPNPKIRNSSNLSHSIAQNDAVSSIETPFSSNSSPPFQGLESIMAGYIFGKKKSTEVAQAVWKSVVRKGDVVIDATCGNGYDTLALLRMIVADNDDDDDTTRKGGRVYAMDLQKGAVESTSSLLERSVTAAERELVEIYSMCHTKMEELIPYGDKVRLVAFNLGYLPGGDKRVKTESKTTLLAIQAAERIVEQGGLISILAYVGHSGGREEFEIVQSFAAGLPADKWVCCKLEMLNRPSAPILVLLYKKK